LLFKKLLRPEDSEKKSSPKGPLIQLTSHPPLLSQNTPTSPKSNTPTSPKSNPQPTLQRLSAATTTSPQSSHYRLTVLKLVGQVKHHGLSHPVNILIDSGSTTNFISSAFIHQHQLTTQTLPTAEKVRLADGKIIEVKDCIETNLQMNSFQDHINFIVLPLDEYDIVLGMSWLATHNPAIDWKRGVLRIKQKHKRFRIRGVKSIDTQSMNNLQLMSVQQMKQEKSEIEAVYLVHVDWEEGNATKLLLQPKFQLNLIDKEKDLLMDSSSRRAEFDKQQLIDEFREVFNEPTALPPKRTVDFSIDLKPGAEPPNLPTYRMNPVELQELKKQLEELLKKKFIKQSKSPFGAPVLFVKKPNKPLRLCIDYRALNALTIKNSYNLPRIDDLFDQLRGAKYFSKIDLRSGYHQIRIKEADREKTGFNCRYGHYQFNVLPFGLTNAPATFMHLMNDTFKHQLDRFVIVYLDDILIYSKSLDEHKVHVREVLQILQKNKLFAKPTKCEFFVEQVSFLGHTISGEGVKMMHDKVEAIVKWPVPENVDDLRCFMGTSGFYRKFIDNFSRITAPLSNLLKLKAKWNWSDNHQVCFDELKRLFTTEPVLILPDPNKSYTIFTDASNYAIGAVLMQDHGRGLQPIAYLSKKLQEAEINYDGVWEKEALSVITALRTWRHYLLNNCHHTIVIKTDHRALEYLDSSKCLTGRRARWLGTYNEFRPFLKIEYIPGHSNTLADAFSRNPIHRPKQNKNNADHHDSTATTMKLMNISTVVSSELLTRIRSSYQSDPHYKNILQASTTASYKINDGLIYNNNGKLCVPNDKAIKSTILIEAHDGKMSGHLGTTKTIEIVGRYFYWNDFHKEIKQYVKSCESCQSNKTVTQSPSGLLQPLEIPNAPWDHVTMDFIGPLPMTSKGHNSIVIFVDKLTKYCYYEPTTTTADATKIADIFFNTIVRRHGIPRAIISDRDTRFTSNVWSNLFKLTGTTLKMSSAYHPQSDGQTERQNQTLETMLRNYINVYQNDWDAHLNAIEFAYNNSKHASTKFTPFYLNHGYHPNHPLNIVSPSIINNSTNPAAADRIERLQRDINLAKQHIKQAQQQQSKYYNKNHREIYFKVGDKVMLNSKNLRRNVREQVDKLSPRFRGPFVVKRIISSLNYELELPPSMKIHPVFHVVNLKKYYESSNQTIPHRIVNHRPPPAVIHQGQEEWEVEKIIGRRIIKRGRNNTTQYLVKWLGYPNEESTWEPEKNLRKSKSLIDQYQNQNQ